MQVAPFHHDRLVASISHLPHVLANALVCEARAAVLGTGHGPSVTGPSLRDATRVAGAPSAIWTDIYLQNADLLAAAIERAVASLEEHPIRQMVNAGVPVTVNSDDPPMFGTTLNREYEIAADLLGLDPAGLAELAKAAVSASFLDPAGKAELLGEIDDHLASA